MGFIPKTAVKLPRPSFSRRRSGLRFPRVERPAPRISAEDTENSRCRFGARIRERARL
jgi:hypothetical protein